MPDLTSRLRQLDDAIANLERLRELLPDQVDAATLEVLRTQRHALAQDPQAVAVMGNNSGDINTGIIIQQAAKPGASREELRRAWLVRVLKHANQLPLFAGDSANAQIRLASVYTALLTQHGELDPTKGQAERGPARQSVLDRLNIERKLVLLGGPGSGEHLCQFRHPMHGRRTTWHGY